MFPLSIDLQALEVTVWRDGMEHKQLRLSSIITLLLGESGSLHFWIKRLIFFTLNKVNHDKSYRMSVSLCLQVTISLKKEFDDPEKNQYTEHFYGGGLSEYVSWLNTDKVRIYTTLSRLTWLVKLLCICFHHHNYYLKRIDDVLGFRKEINGATINVALQWHVVFPINILLQSSLPSFTTPTELNTLAAFFLGFLGLKSS